METRNVSITLDKAREWYNSGNSSLKEVALQAFKEEELKRSYKDITSFEDACEVLDIDVTPGMLHKIEALSKASAAMYKLNIIRRALNLGQNMELTKGAIWYPYNPFITRASSYYNDELKSGKMKKVGKFVYNGDTYFLLGGGASDGGVAGLGSFDSTYGVGAADAPVWFLGCASQEIAQHMSLHFAKEIFEAKYADYVEFSWL